MILSVVIPTYRRPALLSRCLEALCRQQFDANNFEVIVVSDGPDDAARRTTETVRDQSGLTIRYLSLPRRRGPAAARNAGWMQARADLIAFTDDDCIPHAHWLRSICEAYLRLSMTEMAFTGRTTVPVPATPTDYELNISQLATAEFITANCACTKAALMKAGGFDENFSMAWREDSDLQFRLILHRIPIIAIDAGVTHPVRKAPWGVCLREERKGMFDALLYKKFPTLYRKKIQPHPPVLYYLILGFLLLFFAGLAAHSLWMAAAGLGGWFSLELWFIRKRLSGTSRAFDHVMEMIITSLLIPWLSLYWRWYGIVKYRSPVF